MNEKNTTTTTTAPGEERGQLCFVRHEDAGGQCRRPAVMEVHGLGFCETHGEEARLGEARQEQHEVDTFLERFRDRGTGSPVEKALRTALLHRGDKVAPDGEHMDALVRAYPNPPEELVELVRQWQLDDGPGHASASDSLLETLDTMHRLLRIAHQDGETWLVELLEEERESVAAQAAVALALDTRRHHLASGAG